MSVGVSYSFGRKMSAEEKEKYDRIYEECAKRGKPVPKDVSLNFDDYEPRSKFPEDYIRIDDEMDREIKERAQHRVYYDHYVIDLDKLPEDVKYICIHLD